MDGQVKAVGIGELLWDCFGGSRRPGGAPANVAFHVGQLGMTGVVASRVGCDPDGDRLLRELEGRGLSTLSVQRDARHPTGRVTVNMTRADHPAYTIHADAAWDHIALDDRIALAMQGASAICFGTLAQRSATSRATIQRVLEANRGALLVYDVNLRPPWYARDVIETSLGLCHAVKLNDQEVPVVAGLLQGVPPDVGHFALALRERFDLKVVCVTRGDRGCLAVSSEETADISGLRIKVADTVGAGDAFTAGLVCGLLRKWPLADAARLANEVGALVAGQQGAMPDLRVEYARLLDRIPGRRSVP